MRGFLFLSTPFSHGFFFFNVRCILQEQPMCNLFQETERKQFSKRRILAGLNPSEVKASTDIFDDDDIFA